MAGTLVLCLPTYYTGGAMKVMQELREHIFFDGGVWDSWSCSGIAASIRPIFGPGKSQSDAQKFLDPHRRDHRQYHDVDEVDRVDPTHRSSPCHGRSSRSIFTIMTT